MLTTLTCLIAISNSPMEFPRSVVIRHETGHCNCPEWRHGEHDMSSVIPPPKCDHSFKGKEIVIDMTESQLRRVCGTAQACMVDLWKEPN